tara:strand:- start:902 stop:1459 length:558 start_codon:yes stop_codon:yes gene_type:complete
MSSNKSFSTETSDRYARALLELAQENDELNNVEKSILQLLEIYNSSKEFENFVKNPTQSLENQLKVVNKISEKMNFPKILKNFLSILVMKRRIFFLKKIVLSFNDLVSIKRGKLKAQLISSKNLTSDELTNISNELSKVIGSSINFDFKIDESLIGGFKMQIGSLMVDTSLKNKLKKYEQLMLKN